MIVKFAGRLVGAGALILLSLGTLSALEPAALSQAPAPDAPLAGGARGSGTIPGTGTGFPSAGRFAPPPDPIAIANTAEMHKVLDKVTPVTDAMLHNPPPGDWLMWRRTYDSYGFSPLTQINRDNVKNLTVAWTF